MGKQQNIQAPNIGKLLEETVSEQDRVLLAQAQDLTRKHFSRSITFYHPGMFRYHGSWGKYPAISITGDQCELQCDHCRGKLLNSMIPADTPEELMKKALEIQKKGNIGCLVSGGFSKHGTLPWETFIPAISWIKENTDLLVSVHTGFIDQQLANSFKDAGVDEALIDVIGDEGTIRDVCHLETSTADIDRSMEALQKAGIPFVPHIVVGMDHGKINGEYNAINMISHYKPEAVVIVSIMPLPGTPMSSITPPSALEIARIISRTRITMPGTQISLGCARDRGDPLIDVLAIEAGVNRMVIPSDEAIQRARELDLRITWLKTCCSVPIHYLEDNHE